MAIMMKIEQVKIRLFLRLIQTAVPRPMKASMMIGNTKWCGEYIIVPYSGPNANMAGRKGGLRRPGKVPAAPFAIPMLISSSIKKKAPRRYGEMSTSTRHAKIKYQRQAPSRRYIPDQRDPQKNGRNMTPAIARPSGYA